MNLILFQFIAYAFDNVLANLGNFNGAETRESLAKALNKFFKIGSIYRVYNYEVICDERNNTPELIDNYGLKTTTFIKFTKSADFYEIEVGIENRMIYYKVYHNFIFKHQLLLEYYQQLR